MTTIEENGIIWVAIVSNNYFIFIIFTYFNTFVTEVLDLARTMYGGNQ